MTCVVACATDVAHLLSSQPATKLLLWCGMVSENCPVLYTTRRALPRATGLAGRALPGDLAGVERLGLRAGAARYVLVVEKDAVFQALVEDRIWDACEWIGTWEMCWEA